MSSCCNKKESCCPPSSSVVEEVAIKDAVRTTYAQVAVKNSKGESSGIESSCCGAPKEVDVEYCKNLGYSEDEIKTIVDGANMGLGCGNPTAIALLKPGETVVDLGSGGGFDCFLASKKVGPTGHVIGVDMTPEMIKKARLNAHKGKYQNVEFRLGEIEHLPVADNTVDVIISNCVINLSPDKGQVIREAGRILKPGGRIAVSDVVGTKPLPDKIKKDLELHAACIAGATPIDDLKLFLQQAGFINIEISVKEESRQYIKGWSDSGAENFVASASIEATKP